MLVVLIAIVTSVLIRNFFLLENRLTSKSSIEITTSNDDTYYNSFLMVFGILFQQGNTDNLCLTYSFKTALHLLQAAQIIRLSLRLAFSH